MCFASIFGNVTESVLLLLNLLDVLTVNNLYRLHTLKFTHLWYKGFLPDLFQNMQIVFMGIKHQICIQYHLLTESEVITGKSQTEALMY